MTAHCTDTVPRVGYALDDKNGFQSRLALQRHTAISTAHRSNEETLAPLTETERKTLIALLSKLNN